VRYWTEARTGAGDAESVLPTYRILCVGDSHTRGVGAPTALSYPRQLQRLLEAAYPGARFMVMNAGIPGSNSSDTRLEFERQWSRASYDAALVWCG
jgi:lysophospholipase L1-like esterase